MPATKYKKYLSCCCPYCGAIYHADLDTVTDEGIVKFYKSHHPKADDEYRVATLIPTVSLTDKAYSFIFDCMDCDAEVKNVISFIAEENIEERGKDDNKGFYYHDQFLNNLSVLIKLFNTEKTYRGMVKYGEHSSLYNELEAHLYFISSDPADFTDLVHAFATASQVLFRPDYSFNLPMATVEFSDMCTLSIVFNDKTFKDSNVFLTYLTNNYRNYQNQREEYNKNCK